MVSGCFTLLFRHFWLNMGLSWGLMVFELFYHVRVTLWFRLKNSLVVVSANHQLDSLLRTVFSLFLGVMFLQSFWSATSGPQILICVPPLQVT